jgi:site-specific recombinase XerD
MATVFIEKREGKNGISYRMLYKDPVTYKNKYHKTFKKYGDAQEEAAELKIKLGAGKLPKPKNKRLCYMTFKEVAKEVKDIWAERLNEGDLSRETYDGYVLRLNLLCEKFGKKLITNIDKKKIKKFRTTQFKEKYAATSNRNLFILKQVFRHGTELGALKSDPTKDIKYLSEKDHERKEFLKTDGVFRLIEASQQTRSKFYMPALIFLGAEHGAYRQEALDPKRDDIDFDYDGKGLITLSRSKTAVERTEYLMPRTRQALLDWKSHLDFMRKRRRIIPERKDMVFCRLSGVPIKRFDSAWNTIFRIAGFDNLNYHDLRHTFCSNLILSGSDLKEVKEMIGHKDLSSTGRYSHSTNLHKRHTQEKLAAHYARNGKI